MRGLMSCLPHSSGKCPLPRGLRVFCFDPFQSIVVSQLQNRPRESSLDPLERGAAFGFLFAETLPTPLLEA